MKHSITAKDQHSTRIEISRENLIQNIQFIKKKIGNKPLIMAVIKANAYGHDADLVSKMLTDYVDWFAVATISEAENLRKNKISNPILVFAPIKEYDVDRFIALNVTAVAGSMDELSIIPPGLDFHIEFDTGMGRLGFYVDEWPRISHLMQSNGISPKGVMTHFATAEQPDSDKVFEQLRQFNQLTDLIKKEYPSTIFHCSNSGGVLHYAEWRFDMVRTGIAMYGYAPDDTDFPELKPVLSWKSFIAACKPIKKGMSVSYGAKWAAPDDGFLLVVPVGYADGIIRNLSGKLNLFVEGQVIKQVGVVTMDYVMLYHQFPVKTGTEVEIMGAQSMNATDWARLSGTISYEVLCGLHPKIKRVVV